MSIFVDPNLKVKMVCFSWSSTIRNSLGSYIRTKLPNNNTKTFDNCLYLYESAVFNGYSLNEMMSLILQVYSDSWCMDKFHKPYPPFTLAMSRKTVDKAIKNNGKKPVLGNEDEQIKSYIEQLEFADVETAKLLIRNGFVCGKHDKDFEDRLIKKLEEVRNEKNRTTQDAESKL